MVRHSRRGGRPAPPLGVSSVFAPTKYALAMTNQRFSYMNNCIGYYLNPYLGR